MSDLLEVFNLGLAEFGKRVGRVGADQWTASTPCSEWDVRTLVDHVIDEQVWAFYQQLQDWVRREAGEEAIRLA